MALIAKGLVKSFGKRVVVKGVSLFVEQGEIVGLLGPNGAGKTTTFYILSGIERPQEGKIVLGERDITSFRLYRRARLGISFLPQNRSLFRGLSVLDNIVSVLQLRGFDLDECVERARVLLEEYELDGLLESKASTLSGGEARRLEIARALAMEPSFVLLDEPLAGIDPITVKMVQNLVTGLKHKGMGILISDHNVRETLRICDRAYIMNEGQLSAWGKVQELVENQLVRKVYLGEDFRL